jgi:hypothetical protein
MAAIRAAAASGKKTSRDSQGSCGTQDLRK